MGMTPLLAPFGLSLGSRGRQLRGDVLEEQSEFGDVSCALETLFFPASLGQQSQEELFAPAVSAFLSSLYFPVHFLFLSFPVPFSVCGSLVARGEPRGNAKLASAGQAV